MRGLIYVFTGEGKGKTSAAIGVATRALLLEKRVEWISFYKEESWGMAEKGLRERFENLNMNFVGKGFWIGKKTAPVGNKGHVVVDKASEREHREAASNGIQLAVKSLGQKPFLLVMDEVLNAVSEGLVAGEQLINILDKRGGTHIVLTGRGLPKEIEELADLVSECKKIKHPYDTGKLAVSGLDF